MNHWTIRTEYMSKQPCHERTNERTKHMGAWNEYTHTHNWLVYLFFKIVQFVCDHLTVIVRMLFDPLPRTVSCHQSQRVPKRISNLYILYILMTTTIFTTQSITNSTLLTLPTVVIFVVVLFQYGNFTMFIPTKQTEWFPKLFITN